MIGDIASEEIRSRLDQVPFAILRLARARLPTGLRERVHDREWLPELEHILKHAELFPLTRLVTGIRYAAGLLLRAGTVASELQPPDAAQAPAGDGMPRWRRLAARFAGLLDALVWPAREPVRVRLCLAAVTAAAAAAFGVAAAGTVIHARDLELSALVLACGLAAHRRPSQAPGPLSADLINAWLLPPAALLPPVYALIVPAPLVALAHWRTRGRAYAYRGAFSAAANGLAFASASVLAHAAAHPAAGHVIPPGTTLISWTLVITACQLLAVAGTHLLILGAIKVTTPATPLRPLLVNREAVRYEIASLGLGITATFTAAAYPLALIALIPAGLLLHKHLTGTPPPLSAR